VADTLLFFNASSLVSKAVIGIPTNTHRYSDSASGELGAGVWNHALMVLMRRLKVLCYSSAKSNVRHLS